MNYALQHTDQDTSLKRHKCGQMQGYLINASTPAAELGVILAAGDVRVDEA